MDPTDELFVCTISGRCFDRLLSAAEMEPDAVISLSLSSVFVLRFTIFLKLWLFLPLSWNSRSSSKLVLQMKQSLLWDLDVLVWIIFLLSDKWWNRVSLILHVFYVSARAYLLGYNCDDEKELEAALRFCWSITILYSLLCRPSHNPRIWIT